MGLEQIAETFKNSSVRAVLPLGLAFALSTPLTAQAGGGQCAPLAKTSYGMSHDADTSAHIYSKQNPGKVGIPIYPGADLAINGFTADQVGQAVIKGLKKRGVDAECFVNDSMYADNGTAISFKVKGLSIKVDGRDHFGIDQIKKDDRVLSYTASEAKTVKALLN